MKRILLFVAVAVSCAMFGSCDTLDLIKNYEEALSLNEEEEAEFLYGKKWIFNKVGYALESDDVYGVEHVITHEEDPYYPELSSSIESMIINDGSITLNFKQETMIRVILASDQEDEIIWCKSYTTTDSDPLFKFGFDDDNIERFVVYEGTAGGSNYQHTLFGMEKLYSYKLTRMIFSAGLNMVFPYAYYEFLPE